MNICFLSGNIGRSGGTERVSLLIANELVRQKENNVFILSLWPYKKVFYDVNPKIILTTLNNTIIDRKLYKTKIYPILKIRKFLKRNKIDILIDVDTLLANISYYATIFLKCRWLSWEHFNYMNTVNDKKRIKALGLVKKKGELIVLTKKDYDFHINKAFFNPKKIYQIYNPIIKNDLKCDITSKHVLFVGRLTEQKGIVRLLDIWKNIVYYDCWVLDIVGIGEDYELLCQKIKNENIKNVVLHGESNNVEEFYLNSSIFVMTSIYEGFPMVLLEALSYSMPIISFDINTGPSEIVLNNENGFLIPDNNQSLYLEKLKELMFNLSLRQQMSFNCVEIADKFSIDNIIKKWNFILKKGCD